MAQKNPSLKDKKHKNKDGEHLLRQSESMPAEEISRRAEATLSEAQRISHLGSWDWDLATDKIQFSDEMFRLFGMLPGSAEVTREMFVKFLHPDEAAQILLEIHQGAAHPRSNIEHRLILPSGEIRHMYTRVKAYKDENGKPLRLLGSTQDITVQKHLEEALKESEWRTRIVSELTTDYIFVVDVDPSGILKLRWASDNMSRLTGRTIEDAATSDMWRNIIHPQDMDNFFGFVTKILSTAEAGDLECKTLHQRGEERWVRIFARPQVDNEGRVTTIVGAIQDITERKQADAAFRMAELDYRVTFEKAPVGIFRSTAEGRFVKVNQTMADMYGYDSSGEMINGVESIAEQIYSEPNLRDRFLRLLEDNGEVSGFESQDRRKDGSTFWTSMDAILVKNADGQVLYYEGFVTNIDKRKRAEEALRESEERFHSLYDNAAIGIYRTTPDGRVLMLNPAGVRMLGYDSFDEIAKRNLEEEGFEPDYERIQFHARMKRDGFAVGLESEWTRKDGSTIYVRESAIAVKNSLGNIIYYDGTFEDVTERKQAELMLEKSRNLLAETERMGNVGGWEFDIDTREQIWTEEVYRIHELDSTFKPTVDGGVAFYTPASRPIIEDAIQRAIEQGEPFEVELEIVTAKSNLRWVHVIGETDLERRRVFGFFQNITERKQTEMERRVLLEIMQGMISTNDLNDFLKLIHLSIKNVIPAENCFVILYNKEKGLFEEVYAVDKFDAPMPPSKLEKSITAHIFRTAESLLLDQERFDALVAQGLVELVGTNSACWLGAPLQTPRETLGVIAVQDYENPNCYSERDKEFLTLIGAQIAQAIERKYAQDTLIKTQESLKLANIGLLQALEREHRVSRTDSLTDIHNRRYFFEIADHEFSVAKRYGKPLSMIMFDIDHFKSFNDLYGHQVGDEILKYVTQIAAHQLRDADILARYGGEEFVVLLPNSGAQEAGVVAERIRNSIAAYRIDVEGSKASITISVGVAERLASTDTLDQLLGQADRAMYAAKDAGRNCVVIYSA